jgi:hypothetical protein
VAKAAPPTAACCSIHTRARLHVAHERTKARARLWMLSARVASWVYETQVRRYHTRLLASHCVKMVVVRLTGRAWLGWNGRRKLLGQSSLSPPLPHQSMPRSCPASCALGRTSLERRPTSPVARCCKVRSLLPPEHCTISRPFSTVERWCAGPQQSFSARMLWRADHLRSSLVLALVAVSVFWSCNVSCHALVHLVLCRRL